MSSEAGCRRRAGEKQQSPKGHQAASGRTQRREGKVTKLTQGDPGPEKDQGVSRGHSSVGGSVKAEPSEGPKSEGTKTRQQSDRRTKGSETAGGDNCGHQARTGQLREKRCSRSEPQERSTPAGCES